MEDSLNKAGINNSLAIDVNKYVGTGLFRVAEVGHSYEGRLVYVLTCGNGPIKVLAWSQMHGNEPISTGALCDLIEYMINGKYAAELRSRLTLITIPMLNPDGHIHHDRRNAQGIDINRDSQSLISPEARLLMDTWRQHKPHFALNLHDQETRYTSLNPPTPALLAMLAPECSPDKAITPARKRAMQVIANVAHDLSDIAEGRIAKYDDVYTPTAFGDTFMKLGTSSILIEAGTAIADANIIKVRKAMSKAIVSALRAIATGSYQKHSIQEYDQLPLNKEIDGYDVLLKNVCINDPLGDYKIDIGIRRVKTSCNPEDFINYSSDFRVLNIGVIDDTSALHVVEMQGYTLDGTHKDIFIGCDARQLMFTAPDGSYTPWYTLLDQPTYNF